MKLKTTITGMLLTSSLITTGVSANNMHKNDCISYSNNDLVTYPTINEMKLKYSSILEDNSICKEEKEGANFSNFDNFLEGVKSKDNSLFLKIIKKLDHQKQKGYIEYKLERLNKIYDLDFIDNIELIKEIFKLEIFISRENKDKITQSIEKITSIVYGNKIIINDEQHDITFLKNVEKISNIFLLKKIDIELTRDSINKKLKQTLDIRKNSKKIENLKHIKEIGIQKNREKVIFMLSQIEESLKKGDDVSSMIQIFILEQKTHKTYISKYINEFIIRKSNELIEIYNKKNNH